MDPVGEAARAAASRLGFSVLKTEQEKVVREFVAGNDVFVSLPTDYGKSVCFAILPWTFDLLLERKDTSIVLVISPLTALMQGQVETFSRRGLSTGYLCRSQGDAPLQEGVETGSYQLVYTSPELQPQVSRDAPV